jgi:putative transposase
MFMALQSRGVVSGLIHHSDRGSQYAAGDFQKLLEGRGIVCSMSRKGNCYDNTVVDSPFHTLKIECVYQTRYLTREEARRDIFEYIEIFYNRQRLHSSLGYVSPVNFETVKTLN